MARRAKAVKLTVEPLICPRCRREVRPWPIKRYDVCAPKDWIYCIRTYPAVWRDLEKQEKGLQLRRGCALMKKQTDGEHKS
jgi:hypothetical protein